MNPDCIHLTLDPRAVARLNLLAEEQRMTLVDLVTDVLHRYLDDVRHQMTQADAGEPFTRRLQQERAERFDPMLAWLGMSPEARWYAEERGLVQPPWAELEAAEAANDATSV